MHAIDSKDVRLTHRCPSGEFGVNRHMQCVDINRCRPQRLSRPLRERWWRACDDYNAG